MSRRHGFTLLETLVALALTAVVLGALAATVRRAASARTQATANADRTAAVRTLLLRLTEEIEAAHDDDGTGFTPFAVDVPAHDHPWSRLRLASGRADALRAVSYTVEPDPIRRDIGILVRRDAPAGATDVTALPVLDDVRSFRLRCFDGTAWASTCAGRLPRALEVTVGVEGHDELAVTATPAAQG